MRTTTTLCRLIRSLLSTTIRTPLLMEGIIHHKCLGLKVQLLLLGPTTIIRHQRSINPELDFFLMITCHSETLLGTGMAVVHISAEMVTTIITMGADVLVFMYRSDDCMHLQNYLLRWYMFHLRHWNQ